jgi:hypothetical protein
MRERAIRNWSGSTGAEHPSERESWRASASLRTDLALDALEQAIYDRLRGVIVFCIPHKGRRQYRTLRIPESVFRRVLARFTNVA